MQYTNNHNKDQWAQQKRTNNMLGTVLEKNTGFEVRRSMFRLHSANSKMCDQRPALNSPKPVSKCENL